MTQPNEALEEVAVVANFVTETLQQTFQVEKLIAMLIAVIAIAAVLVIVLIYIAAQLKKIADKPATQLSAQSNVNQAANLVQAVQTAPVVSASGNKGELTAVIAAAIAETMGKDVSHIRIHSIRRV